MEIHAGSAWSCVGMLLLAALAGPALGQSGEGYPPDADVPEPWAAYITSARPGARMLQDNQTCELVAGVRTLDGKVVPGWLQLFRLGEDEPFMQHESRPDGVVVAHFPATPGETVIGRASYTRQAVLTQAREVMVTRARKPTRTRQAAVIYGPRMEMTCVAATVELGEPQPLPGTGPG